MSVTNKFNYAAMQRVNVDGSRRYVTPDGFKVPSVTTILDATKSEESVKALNEWRNRVGHAKAQAITTEAAGVGTSMHKQLEMFLTEDSSSVGNNLVHKIANPMAKVIIDNGLIHYNECWGVEVPLFFPEIYAGTTDTVGLWKNKPAILDFKQTNKPKKIEWISDYFLQLVAYSQAHNEIHGTNINTGVILMCSRDLQYQEFVLEGSKFDDFTNQWWKRLEQYYTKFL